MSALPPRLEISEDLVLGDGTLLDLTRDLRAQQGEQFVFPLDRKTSLGAGKENARQTAKPIALSRNSRTVLILMWSPLGVTIARGVPAITA